MNSDAAAALDLGRSICEALDPGDVVGRWMSHHLADLILQCDSSPDDGELIARTQDLILKLWAHKAGAKFRKRPFEYIDSVFAALKRLEPDPPPWAFYQTFQKGSEPPTEAMSTYPLLMAASSLEREIGQLVRLAVAITGTEALALEEQWVVSATALASTEQDRAVQFLEQAARRLRTSASDPQQPADAEAGTTPAASSETAYEISMLDEDKALNVALQVALVRCRQAFDQLAGLMDFEV